VLQSKAKAGVTPNDLKKLTGGQSQVWNYLERKCATASQIAKGLPMPSSEQAVREHVAKIRTALGKNAIMTKSGGGYYRSDAEPDWTDAPRRRRGPVRPK
jgi:hypothetical protein